MESNEQTELTSKTEMDSWIESTLTAMGRWLGSRKTEQNGKRTHGHGQQCGNCQGGSIRGLNGSGKKQ